MGWCSHSSSLVRSGCSWRGIGAAPMTIVRRRPAAADIGGGGGRRTSTPPARNWRPCRSGLGPGPGFSALALRQSLERRRQRREFGHNGCNTATTSCAATSPALVVRPGACYARAGCCTTYSGAVIFVRGPDTSNSIGSTTWCRWPTPGTRRARAWDPQRRLDFITPAQPACRGPKANFDKAFPRRRVWLPPNAAFRCDFVARRVAVKTARTVVVGQGEAGDGRRAGAVLSRFTTSRRARGRSHWCGRRRRHTPGRGFGACSSPATPYR